MMNAEEARRKSLENAQSEIDEVIALIDKAVNMAEMQISIGNYRKLKEGTLLWLKDNGYAVENPSARDVSIIRISW